MGRHELAVADFTKALEARPRSSASYEQRGVSLKALGQTAQAIADLEKALELEPDSETAKKELAELRDAKVSNQPSKETGKPQEPVVAKAASGHKVEITFWNSVKDSNDKAMLEAYLERFPNGAFAPLAKIKLKKLGAD